MTCADRRRRRRGGGSSTTSERPSSSSAPDDVPARARPSRRSRATGPDPRHCPSPACDDRPRRRAGRAGAGAAHSRRSSDRLRRAGRPLSTRSARARTRRPRRPASARLAGLGGVSSSPGRGCRSEVLERATGCWPVSVGGGRWSTAATRVRRSRPSTATAKDTLVNERIAPPTISTVPASDSQAPSSEVLLGRDGRRVDQLRGDHDERDADEPGHARACRRTPLQE